MFLNEDAFKKNSLFGSFERQTKRTEYRQKSERPFDLLGFLKSSDNDVGWYQDLTDKLIEKDHKLKGWKPGGSGGGSSQAARFGSTSRAPEAMVVDKPSPSIKTPPIEAPSDVFSYAPRSPSPPSREEAKVVEAVKRPPPAKEPTPASPPKSPAKALEQQPESVVEEAPTASEPLEAAPEAGPIQPIRVGGGLKNPRSRTTGPSERLDVPYPWQHNKKAVNVMKNWYPLAWKLAFPFPSQLNSAEQRDYIDLHKQFMAIQREHHGQSSIQLEGKRIRLYRKYMHYRNLLAKEYFNFEKFAKAYYRRAVHDDYAKLDANAERYMQELCAFLHDRVRSHYAPIYRRLDEFSLHQRPASGEPNACLKFEANLVRLGNVNKIIFPNVTADRQAPVTLSYSEVSRRTAVYENVVRPDGVKRSEKIYFVKPPLQADRNAEQLALKYHADVVMTSSSFAALMFELTAPAAAETFDPKIYNESEEYARDEFRLPVRVRTLRSADGKTTQRCLFVEKPFVPTHLSKREVNEKYYKRALQATFVKAVTTQLNKEAVVLGLSKQIDSSVGGGGGETTRTTIVKDEDDDYVDHNLLSNLEASIASGAKTTGSTAPVPAEPVVPLAAATTTTTAESLDSGSESESESKKLRIDVDDGEDYQDYDDSEADEEEKLMIVDAGAVKDAAQEAIETPASPPRLEEAEAAPASPDKSQVKADDSGSHYNLRNRRNAAAAKTDEAPANIPAPKVIPLDKVAGQQAAEEAATTSKAAEKKEAASEPSLFELIYKMQEKLTSAQASMLHETGPAETATFHQPAARTLFNYVNKSQLQEMAENPKDFSYVPNKHENVSYALWTLNTSPPMRILVRSSVDGYINDETSSHNKVVVYPKLEYQPQFGCERLSKRDYCRMWCKSFLRLGCNVILCRINVFMNKIGSISNLKNQEILPHECSFNPQQALNQMRDLFRKLLGLKENSYLLEKSDLKAFQILESVAVDTLPTGRSLGSSSASFDLSRLYSFPSRWDKNPLWLPIDPSLYLPYHNILGRIPSTFEPEEVKQTTSPQADQAGLKKKRKRSNASKARRN